MTVDDKCVIDDKCVYNSISFSITAIFEKNIPYLTHNKHSYEKGALCKRLLAVRGTPSSIPSAMTNHSSKWTLEKTRLPEDAWRLIM